MVECISLVDDDMDVQLLSVDVDSVCPVRRDGTVEDAVVIVF